MPKNGVKSMMRVKPNTLKFCLSALFIIGCGSEVSYLEDSPQPGIIAIPWHPPFLKIPVVKRCKPQPMKFNIAYPAQADDLSVAKEALDGCTDPVDGTHLGGNLK